jgi:hypothetical protein
MLPRQLPIASRSPTVFRILQGECQLILISLRLPLSTLGGGSSVSKSFCYSLEFLPKHYLIGLWVQGAPMTEKPILSALRPVD